MASAWDLFDEWSKTKINKSFATRESIRVSAKHLKPYLEKITVDEINQIWWQNVYVADKLKSGSRKFFNDWKWLTNFLKFSYKAGYTKNQSMLENPDLPSDEGIYLSDDEIEALRQFANDDLKLQIELGFRHFMRRSEVLLLEWREINFKKAMIELPAIRTKIRKARKIPISKSVLNALFERKSKSTSEYVFPSLKSNGRSIGRTGNDTAWKLAIKRANSSTERVNPKATFHDLRHSGLTRAFAASNKYAEICAVAGLSIQMAQKTYLHFQTDHLKFAADLV